MRALRPEIDQAILTRVHAVSEPVEIADPEYAHGLRATVAAAVDYGINALERSEERAPPIPAVLLAQARLAARGGVGLDVVLRRYLAGYTLLGDFLVSAAEEDRRLRSFSLQPLLRAQGTLLDRVLAAVSEEYNREEQGHLGNSEQRRADRVRRLLAGELVDTSELPYEFGSWHLGAIATGPGVSQRLSELAESLDKRLLSIHREEGTFWAWFGSRRPFDARELGRVVSGPWSAGITLALGEPAEGLAGWRLTHRQARAALPIARRGREPVVSYADVALLAAVLRDDLLITSLWELFLSPLEQERDGGAIARETLRAYFSTECNTSSAAAALGVTRQTITNRLRVIEERLGRPLGSSRTEMETALRLEDLGYPFSPRVAASSNAQVWSSES